MDQDRSNTGLLESSLETPQNGFGPLEVISVSLQIPNALGELLVRHMG